MKITVQTVLDQVFKLYGVENVAISTSTRHEFSHIIYVDKNIKWEYNGERHMYANIISKITPAELDSEVQSYKIFFNKDRSDGRNCIPKIGDTYFINNEREGEVLDNSNYEFRRTH